MPGLSQATGVQDRKCFVWVQSEGAAHRLTAAWRHRDEKKWGGEGRKAEFTEGLTGPWADTEDGFVPMETKVLRQVESGASGEGFSQLQRGGKRKRNPLRICWQPCTSKQNTLSNTWQGYLSRSVFQKVAGWLPWKASSINNNRSQLTENVSDSSDSCFVHFVFILLRPDMRERSAEI